jgi:hypothetical protein
MEINTQPADIRIFYRQRIRIIGLMFGVLILQLGCFRYWVHYVAEPAVTSVKGGQFIFQVWQFKDPNPKYFGTNKSPVKDSLSQKLALTVGFRPPREDLTLVLKIDSIACDPPNFIESDSLCRSSLDTTGSYGWTRGMSISPIIMPLYYADNFTISFCVTIRSEHCPECNNRYSFSIKIQPTKSKKLRIIDILEGS